ncbi:hypothetical protein GPECTOR_191g300 [Gonium pectorale]|uniref:F-box domain-containing protein n=1 Tax=Gonium pectorale TaxID=33097 RepID=A0A150FX60_GONPE|nr:hypothetical protein GPECTOR_191g300 [Gonium pectorale]|eukprot:KXZ42168.1 hypothetical protein GPECTOR_191g300 [Gonium pectorale]
MGHTAAQAHCDPRIWSKLPPELVERVFSFMDSNEIAVSIRPVSKATASQFNGSKHTSIRLSRPVPPHAFSAHWLAPGATRGLTLKQRRQLLTAASGVVANLEVAQLAAGCCLPTYEVFEAAASAAGGGHWHVCEWLLSLGLTWSSSGEAEAARGGHVDLMEWLLERRSQMRLKDPAEQAAKPVEGAAHGCDLATLQRLWLGLGQHHSRDKDRILFAAAGSPMPDWAAKVEWLEAQGCSYTTAASGHLHVLEWLVETFGEEAVQLRADLFHAAACSGSVGLLAWLRDCGCPWDESAYTGAAQSGCEAALEWLVEWGCPMPTDGGPYNIVCCNGDMATVRCLRRLGVLWGPANWVYREAQNDGAPEPMLRWLKEEGCPVDFGGEAEH